MNRQTKVLITGGSGFIGTNLIYNLAELGYEILNIDIRSPRYPKELCDFRNINILDFNLIEEAFTDFSPDYVVHLAAETGLNGKSESFYSINTEGVKNIAKLCARSDKLKRVVFTSSMLVNEVGYKPKSLYDYNPSTLYGISKVEGEKIVGSFAPQMQDYCIVRPTSIWGEWFSEPYRNFFDYVLSGLFVHPGNNACNKTYGYIGNTIHQITQILFKETKDINGKIFYLGDDPPINISEWANEIAEEGNLRRPVKVPFFFFHLLALAGDFLALFKISFPMTKFRLKNMTIDNVYDLGPTNEVCGCSKFSRREGVSRTIKWLASAEAKK
jgi:GlcNAc-P-P-Und epimerase